MFAFFGDRYSTRVPPSSVFEGSLARNGVLGKGLSCEGPGRFESRRKISLGRDSRARFCAAHPQPSAQASSLISSGFFSPPICRPQPSAQPSSLIPSGTHFQPLPCTHAVRSRPRSQARSSPAAPIWRFHCSTFFRQTPGWIHFLPSLSVF